MRALKVGTCGFSTFRHGQRAMSINRYKKVELADICFIYGQANGNGHASVWLNGERYPQGGNLIIKRLLGCIRSWLNMDYSGP